MSGPSRLLHFERQGGAPPEDDEELTVLDDGSFSARRTIGGRMIGTFAGQLESTAQLDLKRALAAAAKADDLTLETPRHGATEVLEAGGRTLRIGSNEMPRAPWRALVERVRAMLTDEVVDAPAAAIELLADSRTARLVHVGSEPLEVDIGSLAVRVTRMSDEGGVLGRWNGRPAGSLVDNGERLVPTPRWVTAGPGWSAPIPFDHPLELAPGDMLQVWVDVPIRDGERERDGRLYVPVLTDA